MNGKHLAAGLLAASLVAAGAAYGHGDDAGYRDPGHGMGYGMSHHAMGGPGDHAWMGYGMGPGMTGGGEMGPDMMGGYGMGPGMMGGYAGPMGGPALNSEQRKKMARIDTELRKQTWALQGRIIGERGKLYELYAEETPDPKKIGPVYGRIFDLRRQMIEAGVAAQNRQRALLTSTHSPRFQPADATDFEARAPAASAF